MVLEDVDVVEVARFGLIQSKKLLKCRFGSDDGWLCG